MNNIIEKPDKVRQEIVLLMPEKWEQTHWIGDTPVMRVRRLWRGSGPRREAFPAWFQEDGTEIRPSTRNKTRPLVPEPEVVSPPLLDAEEVLECVDAEIRKDMYPEPELTFLDVDVAQAVLRAAAWPIYDEAMGYAETMRGESATVVGKNPDGDKIVDVCIPGRPGGNFVHVIVPRQIGFISAEGRKGT